MQAKRRCDSRTRSARRCSGALPCSASASGTAGRRWAGMDRSVAMQILITDSSLLRTRVLHVTRWQFALVTLLVVASLMAVSAALYHFTFLTAAREGWPVMGQVVKMAVREEAAQRERVMRENLDAIAQRIGEMQAKLVKLEAQSERVTNMANVKTDDLKALPTRAKGGQGGPFVPLASPPTLEQLNEAIDRLDERADIGGDVFTLVESRLFEA